MYSPGLCAVLMMSLCGLFQGVSALGESCSIKAECGITLNVECLGGKCLCNYGQKENAAGSGCEAITGYKQCNSDVDCGNGKCTSNLCNCDSQFAIGDRCELHADPFVLISPSSRGVMAARLSFGTVLLLSALAALVLRL